MEGDSKGPFLYVGMVIPDASIQCAAPTARIRVNPNQAVPEATACEEATF